MNIDSDEMPGTRANPMPGASIEEIDAARAAWAAVDPLTQEQRNGLVFLTGEDGVEARDGLSALEIADAILNVAQAAVATRIADSSLRGASELSDAEKGDLTRLLGRDSTAHERVLLVRTIRVLLPQ